MLQQFKGRGEAAEKLYEDKLGNPTGIMATYDNNKHFATKETREKYQAAFPGIDTVYLLSFSLAKNANNRDAKDLACIDAAKNLVKVAREERNATKPTIALPFARVTEAANGYYDAGDYVSGNTLMKYAIDQATLLKEKDIAKEMTTYRDAVQKYSANKQILGPLAPPKKKEPPKKDAPQETSGLSEAELARLTANMDRIPVGNHDTQGGLPLGLRGDKALAI